MEHISDVATIALSEQLTDAGSMTGQTDRELDRLTMADVCLY